jgi:hypothetical protein
MSNPFVAYVHRFDIVPQAAGSASPLYVLKRVSRTDGSLLGDIVPLNQLCSLASLVARFRKKADSRLSKTNSLTFSAEFWLNKYFTKELYYALAEC